MELGLFLEGLRDALVARGISPEAATKHAAALGRTFSEDDLAEIETIKSNREIEEIADSIAAILYKNKNRAAPGPKPQNMTATPPAEQTRRVPSPPPGHTGNLPYTANTGYGDSMNSRTGSVPREVPSERYTPPAQHSADFFAAPAGDDKTTKGVAIFWTVFILTLPLTLAILAGVLALFGVVFLGIILAIIALCVGMIGVVAAGSGVALVGIIYGITQLFTFVAAGVYEIGLGVMIVGISLFGGVVLYNLAIRFLPWVMSWLTVLFTFVFGRFRNLFYLARRECYKL